MLLDSSVDRIVKLQVQGLGENSPGLRTRVNKLFSSVDFKPVTMPPSSILLVKRVVQKVPFGKSGMDADVAGKHNLESAIRDRINDVYRHASRPRDGQVGIGVSSVLFGDPSELIACLCYSIARGRTASEWWWRSYFGKSQTRGSALHLVVKSMLETPQIVPAVLDQLREWRCRRNFVKLIDDSSVQRITSAVLRSYGLLDLDQQLHTPRTDSDITGFPRGGAVKPGYRSSGAVPRGEDSKGKVKATDSDGYVSDYDLPSSGASPFSAFCNAEISEVGLSKAQIGFVGLAHLLQESPMALSRPILKKQLIDWWHSGTEKVRFDDNLHEEARPQTSEESSALVDKIRQKTVSKEPYEPHGHPPGISVDSATDKYTDQQSGETQHVIDQGVSKLLDQAGRLSDRENIFSDNISTNLAGSEQPVTSQGISINRSEGQPGDATHPAFDQITAKWFSEVHNDQGQANIEKGSQGSEASDEHLQPEETSSDRGTFFADKFCDTQLGGLLYLINLLKQIDLPGSVESTPDLEQHLGPWALLDAVARALMGRKFSAHKRDPIWRMFAGLDRRKLNAVIGKDLPCYQRYAMPQKWFEFFSGSSGTTYYWATHNKRLRIWFDAGILIDRDIADLETVENQVLEAVNYYSPATSDKQIVEKKFGQAPTANAKQLAQAGIGKALAKLLSLMLPSIRCYLRAALDMSRDSSNQLIKELLRCEARIFVGQSHIDLTADVNSTSFAIRACGLDQDPGWLPEYGRVVLFHFLQR